MANIKIFITYKNRHRIIKSDAVTPIQTGRAIADEIFEDMIGDDTGDNISSKNDDYCELSAMYWAWKNYEKIGNPTHVGFMHYRRLLNFNEKPVNDIKDLNFSNKYISKKICAYDCVLSESLGAYSVTKKKFIGSIKEHWVIEHKKNDLNWLYNRVIDIYPQYKSAFDRVLNKDKINWYNIFILKKDLFFKYSEWLFNVLAFNRIVCEEQSRIKGYFAEILLNVFLEYEKDNIKKKEFPLFRYVEPTKIPIVLISSDEFAPYCATTISSIIDNFDKCTSAHFYIITNNISNKNIKKIKKVAQDNEISIINVDENSMPIFEDISVEKHISRLSFMRLLLPELITKEKKIIFIDSDTLVLKNLKDLYNIELENKCFAAVEDVNKFEFGANLGFDYYINGFTYVNAGVLLVDLDRLRKINYKERLIQACSSNMHLYQCSDQCILNDAFRDEIQILPIEWNFYHEYHFMKEKFVPLNKTDYDNAVNSPAVIHFVGKIKPWMSGSCNPYTNNYLQYLRKTPFHKRNKISGGKKFFKHIIQTFFSAKNKKLHKVITILGIKIKFLNSKKLKHKIDNLDLQLKKLKIDVLYGNYTTIQNNNVVTAFNLTTASYKSCDPNILLQICKKQFNYKSVKQCSSKDSLIYIACLLENSKESEAQEVLEKHIEAFGLHHIWQYLPVAALAFDMGYVNYRIQRAAAIFHVLEKHRKEKTFINMLKDKTIAIVGNGPAVLGKKQGNEIDAADIVIRMNNYQTVGFEEDVGSKTDIWVRGFGANDIKDYSAQNEYKFVGITGNYWRIPLYWSSQLEILYRDLVVNKIISGYISPSDYSELRSFCNIDPTTGFSLIYTVLKHLDKSQLKFYGFAYMQGDSEGISTHYFKDRSINEDRKMSLNHSLNEEAKYILSWLYDQNENIGN